MTPLTFDPAASRLTIETRAKGMLAKLAHDLSIVARTLRVSASADDARFSLELDVPVGELDVEGVRKGDRVDKTVLSAGDVTEIRRKIRDEVLRVPTVTVRAEGELPAGALAGEAPRDIDVRAEVVVGRGRATSRGKVTLRPSPARIVVDARFHLDTPALGIPAVKGPLGAFRVDDDVEIVASLVFTR